MKVRIVYKQVFECQATVELNKEEYDFLSKRSSLTITKYGLNKKEDKALDISIFQKIIGTFDDHTIIGEANELDVQDFQKVK